MNPKTSKSVLLRCSNGLLNSLRLTTVQLLKCIFQLVQQIFIWFETVKNGSKIFENALGFKNVRKRIWNVPKTIENIKKLPEITFSARSIKYYGEYFEMPGKACERWFCHVIAFAHFLRNARKSKNFIFVFFSVLK